MKNGLLTVSRMNNNGTDLQCAAMYHIFSKIYKDFEVINYVSPKFEKSRKIIKSFSIKSLIKFPYFLFQNISHDFFRRKNIKISKKIIPDEFEALMDYENIIVGSDQIWNLELSDDINYFLPGLSNVKKHSYAVSIGKTDVSEFEKKYNISSLLKEFNNVSVRESSGIVALKNIGIDAREDLDPILMVEQDWLFSLFKRKPFKKKIIVVYLTEHHDGLFENVISLAKSINAKVVLISEPTKRIKGVTIKSFVGLESWLNYLFNAELIVTDSYHCISTSIAFEKPFLFFDLGIKEKNTRVECLLNKLNMQKDSASVNYVDVKSRLNELRKQSLVYLLNEGK